MIGPGHLKLLMATHSITIDPSITGTTKAPFKALLFDAKYDSNSVKKARGFEELMAKFGSILDGNETEKKSGDSFDCLATFGDVCGHTDKSGVLDVF